MADIRLPPSEPVLAELIVNLPHEAALTVRQLAYQRDRYKDDSALLDRVRAECLIEHPSRANPAYEDGPALSTMLTIDGPPDLLRQLAERLGIG